MTDLIDVSRRRLIKGLGAGALAAQLPLLARQAQAAAGYRALVCVFLYGGNDGNNTIIPLDAAGYAAYRTARGGLAIPQNQVVPLSGSSPAFGLHPDLALLQPVWNAGALTAVFNVGTLVQPLSKSQFLNGSVPVPDNLLSHADQQNQWRSSISHGSIRSGWGGRIVDTLSAQPIPPGLSFVGPDLYLTGASTLPLALPVYSGLPVPTFYGGYASTVDATSNAVAQTSQGNTLIAGAQAVLQSGLHSAAVLNPILTGSSPIDGQFNGLNSGIAQQLLRVARIIASQGTVNASRQIFFVALGSFDTHSNQLAQQSQLFQQLGPALAAFYRATAQLSLASAVTTFTISDFSRTLQPDANAGTDHAWGNHHLVMGGGVRGGTLYGRFPDLTLGGADDVTHEGRWLPGYSVDQYGATLASWFGVAAANLPQVFPNLASFPAQNLGFLA